MARPWSARCYGKRDGSRQNSIGDPALTSFPHLNAREGADGQAVVCPLLRGSSPTRWVAPKQHRAWSRRRASHPIFLCSTNRSGTTAPSRVATFDMTRRATFTTARAGSDLARVVPCMRARPFCIAPASSTAMYVHSNRSAVQRTQRARSRAISMSAPETSPGRSLAPTALSSRDVNGRRSRCGSHT
jgi:hypothetical protein